MLQLRTLGCLYPERRSRRLVSGWLQSQQGSSERTAKRSETVEMCSQPHLPGNYVAVPHVAPALVLHEWLEEPKRKQSRSRPLPTTITTHAEEDSSSIQAGSVVVVTAAAVERCEATESFIVPPIQNQPPIVKHLFQRQMSKSH